MDWNTLRDELRKVSTLLDEWAQRDEIPAVERDLALEKLRKLYEAIRFAGVVSASADEASANGAEEQPESIDLGQVLSLDGFPGLDEPAGPIFVEPAGRVEPAAEATAGPMDGTVSGATHAAASEASDASRAEAARPTDEATAESESRVSEPAGPVETLDVEPAVTLDPLPEPTERSRRGAPTLFGLEDDEVLRHRHKQRVIMSLYDPSPEVERVSSPSRRTGAKQAVDQQLRPIERTPIDIEEPATARPESAAAEQPAAECAVEEPEVKPAGESIESMPVGSETVAEKPVGDTPAVAIDSIENQENILPEDPARDSAGTESPVDAESELEKRETPAVEVGEQAVDGAEVDVAEVAKAENPQAASPAESAPVSEVGSEEGAEPETEDAVVAGDRERASAAVAEAAADSETEKTNIRIEKTDIEAGKAEVETEPSDSETEETESLEERDETPIDVDSAFEELTVESLSEGDDAAEDADSRRGSEPTRFSEPVRRPNHPQAGAESPVGGETLSEKFAEMQGSAVLGEVINHDVQTLADTITPPRNMASELRRSEPVTDLRQAIGLNDRFLLIRDLFGGDAAACDRTLDRLNRFEDLDDCMIFIAEHFAWNPNSDGAKLMMDLLERKFA
mgnify:CR=1 FL=1